MDFIFKKCKVWCARGGTEERVKECQEIGTEEHFTELE